MMNCLLWKSVTVLSLVWAVGGQSSGDLRLVDNSGQTGGSSGRLEVYYSGKWGTVCNRGFDSDAARVACRQLGFSTYTQYGQFEVLGFSQPSSTTPIWLGGLRCSGTESKLINCFSLGGFCYSNHSEDVALVCTGSFSPVSSIAGIFGIIIVVTILIVIIIVVSVILVCGLKSRRRHLARYPRITPLINNATYPTCPQQPPAPYPTGEQPPALHLSGEEAPPGYPD